MTCSNGERISSLHRIHEFTGEPLCMSISLLGIVDSSKKRLQCTGCMLQHTKWLLEHLQWLFKSKLCGPFRYSLRFPFQNSHLSRLPSICVKDQNPCCCFSAFVYRVQVPEKYMPAIYVVLGNLRRRYWNEVRGSRITLVVATIGLGNCLQAGHRFQDTLYRCQ
jgi:hypothetical protein